MPKSVLVLGAKGRFGRAAIGAFGQAGWRVRGFARNWQNRPTRHTDPTYDAIEGDAFSENAVTKAAHGCDVIVNALNPPYEKWSRELPRLTSSVIGAAKATGARVMIPGNVYNYGTQMPMTLFEGAPHCANTRKGMMRVQMEQTYALASNVGVRTIILRGGDFLEREKTGNWFDGYMSAKISKGKFIYPGPLDRLHAWAYLPDMGRAMVELAQIEEELPICVTFGFEGYNLTGAQLVLAIENVYGKKLKVGSMPWPVMKILGLVIPSIREVMEMRYLWQVPHGIDGSRLFSILPDFKSTPLEIALRDCLRLD